MQSKTLNIFLNTPTGISPLDEGSGLDPNPLECSTKFDCTSYVETNLVAGLESDPNDFALKLKKIRYSDGVVDYFQRNHFMVSDWIPENTTNGFVTEITSNLSKDKSAFRSEKKSLNKTIWFYDQEIDLMDQQKKPPVEILSQQSKVPLSSVQDESATYLSTSYFRGNLPAIMSQLPDISIIMMIRNISTTPTLVNHMGFLVNEITNYLFAMPLNLNHGKFKSFH